MLVRRPATARAYNPGMDTPFIRDRAALADASELMRQYGDDAAREAAERARHSRNDGNVVRFCHWRQIARVIASLSQVQTSGTIH